MEAGDVLNTCQACAASVANAPICGSGRGLLRCLLARANGNKDKKFQIKRMRKAFIASIDGFDDARNAKLLKGDELVLYRAAMAWLRLKDEGSYNHIKTPRRTSRGLRYHRKSKTTELGEVKGRDIQRADGSGPALLETANRCFDGDEPDAEAAELAVKAVAEERRRAYSQNTSSTAVTTAVEGARHDRAATQGELAAAGALRSKYPQTRRRAEDVTRGVTAAAQNTYTSAERRAFLDEHFRDEEEVKASEELSQHNAAYRADPASVRDSVRDGSSTIGLDHRRKKKERERHGLLARRRDGDSMPGDYVPVDRSREESVELIREAKARHKAGEGTWVECTQCTTQSKWRSILERPACVLCRSADFIVPVSKPEASSSSEEEEEEGVVVGVQQGDVYPGTVSALPIGCALVKLECGDQGSLAHGNCETGRLPVLNAKVHVRVLRIENKGKKIVLSTKNIDQKTGKLTIATDEAGEPICAGKLDESDWGRSTEPGRTGKPKGGRVFLAQALGDGFTADDLAQVFVVNKKKPTKMNSLRCATRDGTILWGIYAIRKYLEDQRDACKAKPKRRRVESDGPAEGSDTDDEEEEKARLQRALAMSMEEEPASLG